MPRGSGLISKLRTSVRITSLTFVNNGINQAEGVHLELDALNGAVLDAFILLIEVVVESRTIMATITAQYQHFPSHTFAIDNQLTFPSKD